MSPTSSTAIVAFARSFSALLFPLNVHQRQEQLFHHQHQLQLQQIDQSLPSTLRHTPRRKRKRMKGEPYLIKITDRHSLEFWFTSETKGSDCIRKICEKLDIFETDFFGLQYKHKGYLYWINLRNKLRDQIGPSSDGLIRLYFRVKFFVPPHFIQQDLTRKQFYYDILRSFRVGLVEIEPKIDRLVRLVALIAQIELGNFRNDSIDLLVLYQQWIRVMKKVIKHIDGTEGEAIEKLSEELLFAKIIEQHRELHGSLPSSAIYKFLVEASAIENIYLEYYPAMLKDETGKKQECRLGIGKDELIVKIADGQDFCIKYSAVICLKTSSYNFKIRYFTSNGESNESIKFRFSSYRLTAAVYRLVTEKKIFYNHDHVIDSVAGQHVSHFTDLFYSLTKNFLVGDSSERAAERRRCFVFDIERTLKQFRDDIRRKIFKLTIEMIDRNSIEQLCDKPNSLFDDDDEDDADDDEDVVTSSNMNLASTSFNHLICKICRDHEVDTVFVECGHSCCQACSTMIEVCGVCRTHIRQKIRVYFS